MNPEYDIVVVGGGIHGVGVAQAAAASGYKVMLLEKNALASATSGCSSKLIHGGLRYLESWQWGLVRESLRERQILLKIAPKLVKLQTFYIPIYRETTRQSWKIRAGLSLYALLGNLKSDNRFSQLPKKRWPTLQGLRLQGLRSVYRYWDGQTDDRQLTQAVMQSAISLGAELNCPASFISGQYDNHIYTIHYRQADKLMLCQCRALVNAAGPWANDILSNITPKQTPVNIDLVQGTHVVLEQASPNGVYYLEAPRDQRAIFVIPWKGHTLVGTTENRYQGDPALAQPLDSEIEYLLESVSKYFPKYNKSVIESFTGLRVLPVSDQSAFHRSREIILHTNANAPGLATIYGGKLTGYRATAEKVIKLLSKNLPDRQVIADTASMPLTLD